MKRIVSKHLRIDDIKGENKMRVLEMESIKEVNH